jgi:hypothetical protein
MWKLKMLSKDNPQITLAIIAVGNCSNRRGTINVRAKANLDIKVDIVAIQISFVVCLFSVSSEICMPIASENASAIAIVKIPPMTTGFEWVPECRPTINPRVVIIPEVKPKLNPVFKECFIITSPTSVRLF